MMPFDKLRMTGGEKNHEVWVVCPVCGEEYDARLEVHVCEPGCSVIINSLTKIKI